MKQFLINLPKPGQSHMTVGLCLKRVAWATIGLAVLSACRALEQPLVGRMFQSVEVNGK